jgi:RNA polymerase sigma-70 factor (ECF subfamily)
VTAQEAVQAAFRDEWGRIVASLIRRTGDWDLAEEAAQDAFAQALTSWPRDGVPRNPGAWLTTVAGNRALDRIRRSARGNELLRQLAEDPLHAPADGLQDDDGEPIEDDRLRLIFTCCHPALALESRVALTLRALAGLTTAEIARAFLVPEPTMAKRLTRAKAKIAAAGIPYRVPPPERLPERTNAVRAVLYLLFNEGYSASSGELPIRASLCDEAIRLTRLLPPEPETQALLALMLLQHSRCDARLDERGDMITLADQDRSRWRLDQIAEADTLLTGAGPLAGAGPYRFQAEIALQHTRETTDWPRIAELYAELEALSPSPVVRLNRSVALAMAGDLDEGLEMVRELLGRAELSGYHLLHATHADLLRRRGDLAAASEAYERALELAPTEAERRFLRRRIAVE